METKLTLTTKGVIPVLVVAGFFVTSWPSLSADGAGVIQTGPSVRTPTLETLQSGLEDMLDRLGLTHAQHEQVEQIMAGAVVQLQMTRRNANLSVARIFAQEQEIRIQTRRQIASMLSPKQTRKLTELMVRRDVKLENRANDY